MHKGRCDLISVRHNISSLVYFDFVRMLNEDVCVTEPSETWDV